MRGLSILAAGSSACLLLAWRTGPPLLMWNATASVPVGLYALSSAERLTVGDLAVVRPPNDVALLLADRGWLPMGVPLLKPVAALKNQVVCRSGVLIRIDGAASARARLADRQGRALPGWAGCRRLGADDVFLLSAAAADSFDGRYLGPLSRRAVLARATALWLWPVRHDARGRP